MIPIRMAVLASCLALAACRDQPVQTEAKLSQAMPHIPLPPQPTFVQRSAGPDAIQITVKTPGAPEDVATFYRGVFKRDSWRLVNEARDAGGAIVLLAEQDGPPLWVRIRPSGEKSGSLVELSGAVVAKRDTASAKPAS